RHRFAKALQAHTRTKGEVHHRPPVAPPVVQGLDQTLLDPATGDPRRRGPIKPPAHTHQMDALHERSLTVEDVVGCGQDEAPAPPPFPRALAAASQIGAVTRAWHPNKARTWQCVDGGPSRPRTLPMRRLSNSRQR